MGGPMNMTEGDFLRNYSPVNCPAQTEWEKQGRTTDLYN